MKKDIHNKKIIITLFSIVIILNLVNIVYAAYINNITINYTAKTGEMICNVEVDKNDTYVVNGIPYVIVTVKNYDDNDNITAVDVEYSITIKNKEGQSGTYIWQKINNDDNTKYEEGINLYLEQITTNTYSLGNTEKEEHKFKVFIKSSLTSYEDIDLEVVLNSVQKNVE